MAGERHAMCESVLMGLLYLLLISTAQWVLLIVLQRWNYVWLL